MGLKRYAVAYIAFSDNRLTIEEVVANDWQEALSLHSQVDKDSYYCDPNQVTAIEEAKQLAFDCDEMFDVKEITNVRESKAG